jgi:hypothetical protein
VTRQDDLLQAALAAADRGWHVFPCAPGAKHPALRGNWQDHATTDEAQIRAWWTARPFNIGLSCGPSRLVVIDLDASKAPGQPGGPANFTALCAADGEPVPKETRTIATPSGGFHLYFTAPAEPISNSAGRLAKLADIRADGGYIVAAGSRIRDRLYRVCRDAPVAPLPGWLTQKLKRPSPVMLRPPAPALAPGSAPPGSGWAWSAFRGEITQLSAATDGHRHDTLNRAAFALGQIVGAGLLPGDSVRTALADAARHAGLPERDISRIIESAMTAGTLRPRGPRCPRQRQATGPARPPAPPDGPRQRALPEPPRRSR